MAESGILVQYVVRGPAAWGLRVLADGGVAELSNEPPGGAEGGDSAPLAWRPLIRLAPAGLDRLRAVLREADFAALPHHAPPPEAGVDTVITTWDIDLDGAHHTITTVGREEGQHPTLESWRATLDHLLRAAFGAPTWPAADDATARRDWLHHPPWRVGARGGGPHNGHTPSSENGSA
ncbi:MAG TPA: hypothetical protein VF276_06020 [Chloroflexia bacterium]